MAGLSEQLVLIVGPMYSGKSSELIRLIRRYKWANKRTLLIKHSFDKRYEVGLSGSAVITHNKDYEDAIEAGKLEECDGDLKEVDVVGVDESQFFPDLVEKTLEWMEKYPDKLFILAGLSATYKRCVFSGECSNIWLLAPRAGEIKFFKGVCQYCKKDGSYSLKLPGHVADQIDVGEADKYVCVCEKCYRDKNTYIYT